MKFRVKILLMTLCGVLSVPAFADAVRLIPPDGEASCVIVVDPEVMEPDRNLKKLKNPALEEEKQRQRLRESVKDLAAYLQKMSGREVMVQSDGKVPSGKIPVYVGSAAGRVFGKVGRTAPFKQGFRIVAEKKKGVGLFGESMLADSYAVYTFLDKLGCRWFFNGDLGEVIPSVKTVEIEEQDVTDAPYTIYRGGGGYGYDETYMRRMRMGGPLPPTQHCLEGYISKKEKAEHPEWIAEYSDGRPMPNRLKWSNKALAERIGEVICEQQKANPRFFFCLSPEDGAVFDQSAADMALDAGDYDPTFQTTSITDRALTFYNRIVERVVRENPELLFSALAYVQYTRPPLREKPHPNLVIQVAPITYARVHPMNMENVPDNDALRHLVEGWGKASNALSYYFYAYFLADPLSTCPNLRKWAYDIPAIYRKGSCRYWQPETMGNNEFFAMAQWMAQRMAWNPEQDPWALYREANDAMYGRAAESMWKFWNEIDSCWVDTPEYSGAAWGHLRRFTPERIASIDAHAARAAKEAPDGRDGARVKLALDSWRLTKDFLSLRRDLAEGRWKDLDRRSEAWKSQVSKMSIANENSRCYAWCWFGKDKTFANQYFDWFYNKTHLAAARIASECTQLLPKPLTEFRFCADTEGKGTESGAASENFDDSAWKTTNVSVDTWSFLGYHNYMGSMWYRAVVDLPSIPSGKRIWLWVGATDGTIQAFVNGKKVSGTRDVNFKAESAKMEEAPSGYGVPFRFDVTDAVRKGKNVIAFYLTRGKVPNEIGTGGLLSPVTLFVENK